jgi:hypothetical protein
MSWCPYIYTGSSDVTDVVDTLDIVDAKEAMHVANIYMIVLGALHVRFEKFRVRVRFYLHLFYGVSNMHVHFMYYEIIIKYRLNILVFAMGML